MATATERSAGSLADVAPALGAKAASAAELSAEKPAAPALAAKPASAAEPSAAKPAAPALAAKPASAAAPDEPSGKGSPTASSAATRSKDASGILPLLGLTPSAESIDYVERKTQFQLHTLLTEQRHRKTWRLSEQIEQDVAAGLASIVSVDEDVARRLREVAGQAAPVHQLAAAIETALLEKRTVYVYGCGATGRLAKQMESTFWRPFWRRVKANPAVWAKLAPHLSPSVEEALIGEMTGADRALISSLEGFEDLQLIGRLQLQDRGISRGDVVVAVTEGGETSSVIGTILTAAEQWKEPGKAVDVAQARRHLFFVYNNPDDRLRPFERSRRVLEEPAITRINLATGPQAITGSTRMQATTSETWLVGHALQEGARRALARYLTREELASIGFGRRIPLEERLRGFAAVQAEVARAVPALAQLTALEAEAYRAGRLSTYFAEQGLITVFIDGTERSPTFRLYPLDTVKEPKRKCWFQVWTPASDASSAWLAFLGRPFRGLSPDLYGRPFAEQIDDAYLKTAALGSLSRAGDEQQALYDFSFSQRNVAERAPAAGDLGVLIAMGDEVRRLADESSPSNRFAALARKGGGNLGLVMVTRSADDAAAASRAHEGATPVVLKLDGRDDPFGVGPQVGLKMLLNAHSTGVMARLGKVVGNTMTSVSPSNLKLIGRATFLVQSHVNDVLARPQWAKRHGRRAPLSYAEANAVLFDAIDFLKAKKEAGQTAEVALAIVRVLESARQGKAVGNDEAFALVTSPGLARYLAGAERSR